MNPNSGFISFNFDFSGFFIFPIPSSKMYINGKIFDQKMKKFTKYKIIQKNPFFFIHNAH